MSMSQLDELIRLVEKAHKEKDEEKIFELSADVMSVYLEALSDIHFGGAKTDWLNSIVTAVDGGDSDVLISVLEEERDNDERFLGSQVAALFAGFRQRDSMMTIAQTTGIKALLENM